MNIASITVTLNDSHSIQQWSEFYNKYHDAIFRHIIVDNNSTPEYKNKLAILFPNSVLIERTSNGGTTAAYNDGIKYALSIPEIDAIMLIANDIDIDSQSIDRLKIHLSSHNEIGAVAPVLLMKDKRTILAHGEKLKWHMGLDRLFEGQQLSDLIPQIVESECLPGGMNLVRRNVYEVIGLQDESLFIYMDENDFFSRAKQHGFRLLSVKDAVAAHCHIPVEGKHNDNSLAWFYINRNHILVCKRYRTYGMTLRLFCDKFFRQGIKYSVANLIDGSFKKIYYYYLGLVAGLIGFKKNFVKKSI